MSFLRSAAITLFSNLFLLVISIVSTVVTSRLLGPEGRGILGIANNFLSFAALVVGFGMASANVYFIGKRPLGINKILGNNMLMVIGSIAFLIPLYFLNQHYQFAFLKGLDNTLFILVLVIIPLANLKAALLGVFLGVQDIIEYNRLNIIDTLTNLTLLVIFISVYRSPKSVILATLVGTMIICLVEFYIILKLKGHKIQVEFKLLTSMLGYGIKAQVGNIIQILNYRLDIFIINYFLPLSQVGIYTIAVALGEMLWKVSGSVATLMFPIVSSSTNAEETNKFTNQVTRITFALIILFSVLLGLISKPLIWILFGQSFIGAANALLWLIPGISIFSVSNVLANYLAGIGQIEKNIFSSVISCIVTVVLDILLIPRMGITGASIATSISYIVFTLLTLMFYVHHTKCQWYDVIIIKRSDVVLAIEAVKEKLRNGRLKKGG